MRTLHFASLLASLAGIVALWLWFAHRERMQPALQTECQVELQQVKAALEAVGERTEPTQSNCDRYHTAQSVDAATLRTQLAQCSAARDAAERSVTDVRAVGEAQAAAFGAQLEDVRQAVVANCAATAATSEARHATCINAVRAAATLCDGTTPATKPTK